MPDYTRRLSASHALPAWQILYSVNKVQAKREIIRMEYRRCSIFFALVAICDTVAIIPLWLKGHVYTGSPWFSSPRLGTVYVSWVTVVFTLAQLP